MTVFNHEERACAEIPVPCAELMRQYRALDDSINLRLNRSPALRRSAISDPSTSRDAAKECDRFWKELLSNWMGREEVIRYCVGVLDLKASAVASTVAPLPSAVGEEDQLQTIQRKRAAESAVYGLSLRRRMVHDELSGQSIRIVPAVAR